MRVVSTPCLCHRLRKGLIHCRLITLPLPTHRLASSALRALSVDAELSPLVRRSLLLTSPEDTSSASSDILRSAVASVHISGDAPSTSSAGVNGAGGNEGLTVLKTEYKATTNRMLRVAVNGFMESLGVVLGVMEELDIDVLGGEECTKAKE